MSGFLRKWYPEAARLRDSDRVQPGAVEEAEERLGLRLPALMREWYDLCGDNYGVSRFRMGWQRPDELQVEDGLLIVSRPRTSFRLHDRHGIHVDRLGEDDPPVRDAINDSAPYGPLSEFLVWKLLMGTCLVPPPYLRAVSGTLRGRRSFQELLSRFSRVPVPASLEGGMLLGDADTVVLMRGDHVRFELVARSRAAFERALDRVEDLCDAPDERPVRPSQRAQPRPAGELCPTCEGKGECPRCWDGELPGGDAYGPYPEPCGSCDGTGLCPDCGGRGGLKSLLLDHYAGRTLAFTDLRARLSRCDLKEARLDRSDYARAILDLAIAGRVTLDPAAGPRVRRSLAESVRVRFPPLAE